MTADTLRSVLKLISHFSFKTEHKNKCTLIKCVDTTKLKGSSNSREDWNITHTEMTKLKTIITEIRLHLTVQNVYTFMVV